MPGDAPLPVVAPTRPPAKATPGAASRAAIAAAILLGACVVGFSVRAATKPASEPGETATRREPRFGKGSRPRLERLRDRLAKGLLSMRAPAGDFVPAFIDPRQDENLARREANAMAVAGLAAAKRLGSRVEGLEAALESSKAVLTNQRRGSQTSLSIVKPDRGRTDAALGAGILALLWNDDPADAPRVRIAAEAVARESRIGPLARGWPRAVVTRAIVALEDAGLADALGAPPTSVVQVDEEMEAKVDCGDPRVSDAFARRVAGSSGSEPRARAVLTECVKPDELTWDGPQTDLHSWVMQAWLAARTPEGDVWFERVLPLLERAPDDVGVIRGTYYGEPVARTAEALWILLEGWERPPEVAKGV